MKYEKIEEGVAVFKDGKFWGQQYDDGRSSSYGWVGPKKANISDPRYLTKPSDMTYTDSHYTEELNSGKIVKVKRTTMIEVIE